MLVSVPLLIGFATVSEDVVKIILGDEWLPVVPVLIALCFARVITPISSINLNILNAIGRSDLFLKVDLSKLPMTLAALFIALPYGIEGLAWAMVCTSFISFFINAYFPGKLFGFGGLAQLKVAYKYIIAAAFMYFSVSQVSISDSLWLTLAAKVTVGGLIYPALLFIMRDAFLLQNARPIVNRIKMKLVR